MPEEMSIRYYGIDDAYAALDDEEQEQALSAEMDRETHGGMTLVAYVVVTDIVFVVLVVAGLVAWWVQ